MDPKTASDAVSPPKTPTVVVIDGEIGAGKTTLIQHVAEALRAQGLTVALVPEPVEAWERVGILEKFYAPEPNRELRAHVTYDFQTFTFVTRIQATAAAARANPDADVFLLERSIFTDRFVFMELQRELVGPMLMKMYDVWWETWSSVMPFAITKAVYLKPTLGHCQARVAARARAGEVGDGDETACGGVSATYQARLRRAHEAYLEGKHAGEFPDMPPRPHKKEDVLVVGGDLADADFSTPRSPGTPRIVRHIVGHIVA